MGEVCFCLISIGSLVSHFQDDRAMCGCRFSAARYEGKGGKTDECISCGKKMGPEFIWVRLAQTMSCIQNTRINHKYVREYT